MTDKEISKLKRIVLSLCLILIGLGIGASVVSLRYDSEIRHTQLDLKAQVEEIMADKATVEGLIQELLSQIEQLKVERQELRELKILLGKGE